MEKKRVALEIRDALDQEGFQTELQDSGAAVLLKITLADRAQMQIRLTADFDAAVSDILDFLYAGDLCRLALHQLGDPGGLSEQNAGRGVCISAAVRLTLEIRRAYDVLCALSKRAQVQKENRAFESLRTRLAAGETVVFVRSRQKYTIETVDRDGRQFIELRAIGDQIDPYVPIGTLLSVECDPDVGAAVDRFLSTSVFGTRSLQESLPYIEFAPGQD